MRVGRDEGGNGIAEMSLDGVVDEVVAEVEVGEVLVVFQDCGEVQELSLREATVREINGLEGNVVLGVLDYFDDAVKHSLV